MGTDAKHSSHSLVFIIYSESNVNEKVALCLIEYASFPYTICFNSRLTFECRLPINIHIIILDILTILTAYHVKYHFYLKVIVHIPQPYVSSLVIVQNHRIMEYCELERILEDHHV